MHDFKVHSENTFVEALYRPRNISVLSVVKRGHMKFSIEIFPRTGIQSWGGFFSCYHFAS